MVHKLSHRIHPATPSTTLTHHKKCDWHQLSAGFIWMANAANMIPKTDTKTKTHFIIPANMKATHHRIHETKMNHYWFKKLFSEINVKIHSEVKNNDEGAANNIRLWSNTDALHIWVHGHPNRHFHLDKP